MALDPRISLAATAPIMEPLNLVQTMLAAGQLREQQSIQGLRALQAQQLQDSFAKRRAIADVLRRHYGGDGGASGGDFLSAALTQTPLGAAPTAPGAPFGPGPGVVSQFGAGGTTRGTPIEEPPMVAPPGLASPPPTVASPTPTSARPTVGSPPAMLPGMSMRRFPYEQVLAAGLDEAIPVVTAARQLEEFQVRAQAEKRQTELLEMQQRVSNIEHLSQGLAVPTDQATYDAMLAELGKHAPSLVAQLPKVYDPAQIESLQKRLQIAKTRATQALHTSLNVTPGYDASGNPVPLQATSAGELTASKLPPGVTYAPPGVQTINTPTSVLQRDRTGRVISETPKDVSGAAEQKEHGKYAGELPQLAQKASVAMQQLDQKQKLAVQDIDRALQVMATAKFPTTGIIGEALSFAYQPGKDLRGLLASIGAQMGFDELQGMRDASPTGGALGQVSDFENKQLQALRGNIQASQSAAQLKDNLQRLKEFIAERQSIRRKAYDDTFGRVKPRQGSSQRTILPKARAESLLEQLPQGVTREQAIEQWRLQGIDVEP